MKTMMSKKAILTSIILTSVALPLSVFAADENNTAPGLTAVGSPLGLHGVDPVAFIDINNRIEGNAKYAAAHDGVAYYFASKENADKFTQNPKKYSPQNGGFCTFGVSVGKKFDGDPQYADIFDGKLYVFLNEEIFNNYLKDRQGTIKKAEAHWKKIKHVSAIEL